MASTINGTSTGNGGLVTTGDDSGILQLQTNETTAVTIDANQAVTIQGLTVGKGAGSVATNTAVGASALAANTSGSLGVAVGYQAAYSNTTGIANSALGYGALYSNTTGGSNTALGEFALQANTTASNNTAVGYQAGYTTTTGIANTFAGYSAGYSNTTGTYNTFIGNNAGYFSSTSSFNTYIGHTSGYNSNYNGNGFNTFIGSYRSGYEVTSGIKNSILGNYNGNQGGLDIRTASNYIVLSDGDGNPRLFFDGSGILFSPPVYTTTTANAANMYIHTNGAFYRSTSSLKYKTDVQDANHGLAEVLALRSVTYKGKSDGNTVFGGLIAEEVHEAGLTEFVQYAEDGSPDALAYGQMVSLAFKAIQELNAKVEAQAAEIAALKGQA